MEKIIKEEIKLNLLVIESVKEDRASFNALKCY